MATTRNVSQNDKGPGHQGGWPLSSSPPWLAKIFPLILQSTGLDLRYYKTSTIRRLVLRRMTSLKIRDPKGYIAYLKRTPAKINLLSQDVLIKVTSFFRDPDVFKVLCQKVIPTILKNRTVDQPLRIWVPGCCTGEEVYSIAISAIECLEAKALNVGLQIFGTDVSDLTLEKARAGLYPERIKQAVSRERLDRFFTKVDGNYQINKHIRGLCTFARQNLIEDPPFSRQDLISCRNVLIYLGMDLQNKIFPRLHYALNPLGFLLLGKSESIGSFFPELFSPIDKRHNIYARKYSSLKPTFDFRHPTYEVKMPTAETARPRILEPHENDLQRELDRIIVYRYSPAAVLINDSWEVIQTRGDLTPYLKFATGKMSINLLKLARDGLLMELRLALEKLKKHPRVMRKRTVPVKTGPKTLRIDFEILPLLKPHLKERFFLVVFGRSQSKENSSSEIGKFIARPKAVDRALSRSLRQELETTRAYLQSVLEDYEVKNQELRSANEEILSSNEELQSTNEELETAKEELESTNEEITTVNEELESRNAELKKIIEKLKASEEALRESQENLSAVVETARDAIISADQKGNIIAWNKSAETLFGYPAAEVIGCPLTIIMPERFRSAHEAGLKRFNALGRGQIIGKTLELAGLKNNGTEFPLELSLSTWKTAEDHFFTAIIRDISDRKKNEEALCKAKEELEMRVEERTAELAKTNKLLNEFFDNAVVGLNWIGPDGIIQKANKSELDMLGYEPHEYVGHHLREFHVNPEKADDILARLKRNEILNNHEVRLRCKDGAIKHVLISSNTLWEGRQFVHARCFTRDITARKLAEEALKNAVVDLERSNKELEQFAYVASHDLQEPLRMVTAYTQLLGKRYKGKLDQEADEFIRFAVDGAFRAQTLIKDLLEYSKVRSPDQALREVKLENVLDQVTVNLKIALSESQAALTHESLPTVVGDEVRLTQLFQNLINNAIKFRGQKPPRIHISVKDHKFEWLFAVKDSGIGIDPQYHEKIFIIFQRLHTRAEFPGTGIGLAICKKIVEAHAGRIWVHSSPDKGATFYFTIPKSPP